MLTQAEQRLRTIALVLTALLLLQLLWSGIQWVLVDRPDAIVPAAASLAVTGVRDSEPAKDGTDAVSMVSRPLFWAGREPYVVPEGMEDFEVPIVESRNSPIEKATLLGVYTAGKSSGVVILHNGERRRLKMNDVIDGWELTMLSPDGAIFENGSESTTLGMVHALAQTGKKKATRVQANNRDRRRKPSASAPAPTGENNTSRTNDRAGSSANKTGR